MRILFVHNYYRHAGGEDQVVKNEMELLVQRKHEVKLLKFQNDHFEKSPKAMKALFFNRLSFQKTIDVIHEFAPDVIHVHNFFYQASPSIFYATKQAKVPVVLTFHNYRTICASAVLMRNHQICELCIHQRFPLAGIRLKCFQESTLKTALLTAVTGWHKYRQTWSKQVDRIITLTDFAKQKFISSSLGIPEHKFVVKANSVGDHTVKRWEERRPYLVFVGRLSPEKGIEVLLKAIPQLHVAVRIIGDGPLIDQVSQCCQTHKHSKYLGQLSHERVMEEIQYSQGLILPSTCYEGLPTTALEAFSTGTPVVASDIGNINEIVKDQWNGLLFRTGDAADLASKVNKLRVEEEQWQILSAQARHDYEQHYSHESNYKQLMQIYQEVCDEHVRSKQNIRSENDLGAEFKSGKVY